MAEFTEHIRILISSASDVTGIKNFRTEVANADGALGKIKAGGSAVFSAIGANAGLAALVIGGGLVKAGIDAVDKFDAMAVSARNLATATGLTVEQASRWIGAAKDMGVNQDLLFHGMSQIAKHIESDVWATYGIQVHDAAGQLRPVNDILLDAAGLFDSLTNSTAKAEAGEALFRRGYRTLAPLFEQGKAALQGYLASVEDSQVITGHELAQAQENIRAQKDLKQAFGSLSLTLGELLVSAAPVLRVVTDLVNPMVGLASAAIKTFTGVHQATDGFEEFFNALEKKQSIEEVVQHLDDMTSAGSKANGFLTNFGRTWSEAFSTGDDDAKVRAENWADFTKELKDTAQNSPQAGSAIVSALHDVLNASDAGNEAAKKAVDNYGLTIEKVNQLAAEYSNMSDASQETNLETNRLTDATIDYADAQKIEEEALKEAQKAIDDHKKALQEQQKAADDGAKANKDYRDSINDIRKAQEDAVPHVADFEQSVRDVDSAYFDLQTQEKENIKTQKDHKLSDDEKAQSTRDVATAQHELSGKILEMAQDYAASRGDVEGSTASINDQIAALEIAKTKYPELAGEIDQFIAKLKSIPPEVDTNVKLHLDAHIDNIIVDGETHAAGSTGIFSKVAVNRSATGIGAGWRGGFTTLGEQGGEAVFLPQGSRVLGASQTAQMDGMSHIVDNSTHIYHLPPGLSPSVIAAAQREYERRGGR